MKQLRNAFTLIELLVVISIIAILIALLFPVFSIAEDKANRAKCLSNLHQIAIAAAQQFGDLGEKMPFRGPRAESGGWDNLYYGAAAEKLMPYVKNIKEIFDCPANPGNTDPHFQFPTMTNTYTDYEFNGYLCAYGPPDWSLSQKKQNRITDYSLAAYAYDNPYAPGTSPHNDGINIAYLDGHAAWLANADMRQTNRNGTVEYEFYVMGHAF